MSKNLQDKSDYVVEVVNTNGGLNESDNLACKYIYDITTFLVNRKINTVNMSSEIPEEIIQNIVVQVFYILSKENMKKNPMKIKSMFSYISKCVSSELCKIYRNKYMGQKYIQSGLNLDIDYDVTGELSFNHTYEIESEINIYKTLKNIMKEAKEKLKEHVIPVDNKELLLFPLLLAIAREEDRILNKFKIRIRTALKQIYTDIGSPTDRMK